MANLENKVQLDDKDHVVFPDPQESPEKLLMRTVMISSVDHRENRENKVFRVFKDLLGSLDNVDLKVKPVVTARQDPEERKASLVRTDFVVPMVSKETADQKVSEVLMELLVTQGQVEKLDQEEHPDPKETVDSKDHVEPPVKTLYVKDPQDRRENPEKLEHQEPSDSKETKVQSERKVTKVFLVSMVLMELVVILVPLVKLETQVLTVAMDRRENPVSDVKDSKEIVDQPDPTDQLDLVDPLDFKDKRVNLMPSA